MSHKKGMWYLDDVILYLMTPLTNITDTRLDSGCKDK